MSLALGASIAAAAEKFAPLFKVTRVRGRYGGRCGKVLLDRHHRQDSVMTL
jgi:hypothetical protein